MSTLFQPREVFALYVRNFIFGVEDSLVSTVGLLSGIAAAGVPKREIVLSGTILIFVEAFSMGIGSLLSEHSAEKYMKRTEVPIEKSLIGGIIMFVSYFVAGFVPLFPYVFFDPGSAFTISILLSLGSLFLLGIGGGKVLGIKVLRNALEMFLLGGAAVAVGILVGQMIK